MLDTVTMETFQPRVGELFRVIVDEKWEMQARLSSVDPWSEAAGRGRPRAPFSLVFHAPQGAVIPQQIYRVENANLEPMELFLVPIGPDEHGMRYEAVFT
jgi:hypothetical protein